MHDDDDDGGGGSGVARQSRRADTRGGRSGCQGCTNGTVGLSIILTMQNKSPDLSPGLFLRLDGHHVQARLHRCRVVLFQRIRELRVGVAAFLVLLLFHRHIKQSHQTDGALHPPLYLFLPWQTYLSDNRKLRAGVATAALPSLSSLSATPLNCRRCASRIR